MEKFSTCNTQTRVTRTTEYTIHSIGQTTKAWMQCTVHTTTRRQCIRLQKKNRFNDLKTNSNRYIVTLHITLQDLGFKDVR